MDNYKSSLTEKEKQDIINILTQRIPNITCPMCQNRNFVIADGYFNQPITVNLNSTVIGGPSIPSIGIVCDNCGFISQHALGVLGLLNKNTDNSQSNE